MPDVIVIGAGAIGASVAYQAAKRGLSVHVLEAEGIAAGATGASEGLVGSIAKRKSGPVTDIVVKSFSMFSELAEELDIDFEYQDKPGLMVVTEQDHVEVLKRFVAKRQAEALEIEWLDRRDALEAEPVLGPKTLGAVWTPRQGSVNPMKLAFGYLRAARRLGATVSIPARVTGFEFSGGSVRRVLTTAGDFSAETVVNAAGVSAPEVAGACGAALEIVPKRAQMLVSEALPKGMLRNTVYAGMNVVAGLNPRTLDFEDMPSDEGRREAERECDWQLSSFTQTTNGNILFCGGFGFSGDSKAARPRDLVAMMRNIAGLAPTLADVRILRGWAGLEPCTRDNVPAIGRSAEVENLVHAAGHGNAGVMMSPYTGSMVAEEIVGASAARKYVHGARPAEQMVGP